MQDEIASVQSPIRSTISIRGNIASICWSLTMSQLGRHGHLQQSAPPPAWLKGSQGLTEVVWLKGSEGLTEGVWLKLALPSIQKQVAKRSVRTQSSAFHKAWRAESQGNGDSLPFIPDGLNAWHASSCPTHACGNMIHAGLSPWPLLSAAILAF